MHQLRVIVHFEEVLTGVITAGYFIVGEGIVVVKDGREKLSGAFDLRAYLDHNDMSMTWWVLVFKMQMTERGARSEHMTRIV